MSVPAVCEQLRGRLIASCQAAEGDPFRAPHLIAKFAQAAVSGGAAGIRAEGPEDVRAVRAVVPVPVIGIRKVLQQDGAVLITPTLEHARELVEAGAGMIALDCTARGQSFGALERLRRIRSELNVPVLADIATLDEAIAAAEAGADFVLSTMRGYTAETRGVTSFEPGFIRDLVNRVGVPVIAEGRIHTPEQARAAIASGAFAVIVGTAISRPKDVARSFARAVEDEAARARDCCVVGIDLGGTNTKLGLVARDGKLLFSDSAPTPAAGGGACLLAHLKNVARQAVGRSIDAGTTPAAIGIATAGWVDTGTGTVAYATENLPGWTGTRIADEIGDELHLPVAVENDANALAIAEKHFGAGQDLSSFVCITLGTGVGGGCYIGNHLNRGAHFFANAIGHLTLYPDGLLCSCGKHGCLEPYTNQAALMRYAGDAFPDGRAIIQAANSGDTRARDAIRTLARHLAQGCASIVQLLDPEAIILSGGLAQDNPLLFSSLAEFLACFVSTWDMRRVRILSSGLGYHGGVLGAAAVALERL